MSTLKVVCGCALLMVCFAPAQAQERPFLFTLVAPDPAARPLLVHYDAAYGRGTFEPLGGDNLEQTLGVHANLGESLLLVARVGLATDNVSTHSSQHAEVLMRVLRAPDGVVDLSVGPGFRHEYGGTNVLLARAVVGRRFSSWQVYGNVLLEKPFSADRDPFDLILTTGASFPLSPAVSLGVEAVGQDLEGFWEEEEAEGGARLFIGPTLAVAIPGSSWALTLGAGPIIRASQGIRTSSAPRDLPTTEGNGFVIRAAVSFAL